jgi:predicted signal transduction protein with EAL and GGDEF domain
MVRVGGTQEVTELAHAFNQGVFVTASMGIVRLSGDYKGAVELLRDADLALYRAKNNGRARYEVFDIRMHLHALQRLQVENDLRKALENEEFQPPRRGRLTPPCGHPSREGTVLSRTDVTWLTPSL